ncbi:MAG: hypothetical protein WCF04_12040 [Candidatus Nanopelagicales bacterium]
MMGGYGWGVVPWMWVFMGLFWLLLIGLIVWLVVKLLPSGNLGSSGAPRPGGGSALEVLDHRLAAGEIDVQTYSEIRDALLAAHREQK